MPFAVSIVWREPHYHLTDCYFCMTSTFGFSSKNKHTIQYTNIPSAVRPVPHSESLPIPVAPKTYILQLEKNLEDFEPQPEPSTSTDEYPTDLVHR
ncbi:hypothetical protein AVEN_183012-1 [Araneus ventricosus]|uniref:Uncharacterized protein n=1 Tax=Araneus ventricosus TaxID=182803 RepID=A0A4Y2R1F2_ARAVE|nr:hypothetical protein AVEN_183012-1 [Araneus ventricosus]